MKGALLISVLIFLHQPRTSAQRQPSTVNAHVLRFHLLLPPQPNFLRCLNYGGREFHSANHNIYNLVVSNLNISDLDFSVFSFPDCCCNLLLRERDMRADGSEKICYAANAD